MGGHFTPPLDPAPHPQLPRAVPAPLCQQHSEPGPDPPTAQIRGLEAAPLQAAGVWPRAGAVLAAGHSIQPRPGLVAAGGIANFATETGPASPAPVPCWHPQGRGAGIQAAPCQHPLSFQRGAGEHTWGRGWLQLTAPRCVQTRCRSSLQLQVTHGFTWHELGQVSAPFPHKGTAVSRQHRPPGEGAAELPAAHQAALPFGATH